MLNPTPHNNTTVIIPAFNEEAVIKAVIADLQSFPYTIIVVDDASASPLRDVLSGMEVTVLRHQVNLGQGAALQTGIEYALQQGAAYIVTYDADGQHQPQDIGKLLAPLLANEADITLGSRFLEGASHNMTSARKGTIQLARGLNYFFTGLLLTDAHNGLRAMTAKTASLVHLRENRMAHATEFLSIIRQHKLRYKEVPVTIRYTDYSRQKGQRIWSGFRIFFDLFLNKIFK